MGLPNHQTIAAYLALFVALATGGAYAAEQIGSGQIENNSIRSADLKNRKAVKTKDVKPNGLRGKAIDEASLDASRFLPAAGEQAAGCNPESGATFIDCNAAVNVTLPRPGRIVAIATGGQRSDGGAATAICEIRIDAVLTSGVEAAPGEEFDNTSGSATNGFARTAVSDTLGAGRHRVALACKEGAGDVRIDHPTIAAFGISGG